MAEDADLDISRISGSGPNGRIVKKDVQRAIEAGSAAPAKAEKPAAKAASPAAAAPVPTTELKARTIKVSGMRKTIAKRLVESKTSIPHFTVTVEIDMQPLMALRKTLNDQLETQGVKLSVNDFVVRATALALVQHSTLNSTWTGDSIEVKGTVNMGIAVALPEERGGGLVVPVIRDSHAKGLRSISLETKKLAKKAREAGLSPDEMADGTFTISNLGMLGVQHFEAIINPSQVGILAVGAALEKPVVKNGEILPGLIMTATLSADHRVVDGAMGAEFLQTFKTMIENPAVLLV
jgi:pyruvate dehydrogenase E2 component (dihydrolipoamide acetyltransferase)